MATKPERQKIHWQKFYEANKDEVKRRAKEHTAKVRIQVRAWLYEYLLSHPCVDCGESDPIVLEFDHQRDKEFDVSAFGSRSLKKVIAEVEKCQVRCANCHRRVTYHRAGRTHRTPAL